MPIMLYPKCWRNREDCEPIHCVDGVSEELTEEQVMTLDYTPDSFVCSGCVQDPEVKQDKYRLCFKNHVTDEMTDNDMMDLTSIMSVCSAAMNLDAIRKVSNGIVELPAAQKIERPEMNLIKDNVVFNKTKNRHLVIREPRLLADDEDFVCSRPHEDGNFAYLCNFEYCRCSQ